MSQETINLIVVGLIGFVPSLLMLILNNHFQNKREERSRKWELEDRQSNRSLIVLDSQIKEAQVYITNFVEAVDRMQNIGSVVERTRNKEPEDFFNSFEQHWKEVASLSVTAAKKLPRISLINDMEFKELNEKLLILFNQELENLLELIRKIAEKESLDRETAVKSLSGFYRNAEDILFEMQRKLDEIAKTI